MNNMNSKQASKRLLMMITGAVAIFFTGFIHVWSVFLPYVTEVTGWTEGQASLAFYIANSFFVFGNIIGGRLENQSVSRKKIVGAGSLIFAAGVLLASRSLHGTPVFLYLTLGVMVGIGEGMIYTIILATAQKWFPERRGFASGTIVTANGLCGFFLAPFSRALLKQSGPETALLVTGILIAAAGALGVWFYAEPEERNWKEQAGTVQVPAARQYTPKEMFATSEFYLIMLAMIGGLMPYFLLSPVSQTLQMDTGVAAEIAVASVMAGSVMNAASRLVLPSIADKVGRIPCILGVFAVALAAMLLLVFGKGLLVTAAVILAYTCFGGVMGNFPSLVSQVFGMAHFSENYGYVMISLVIASISSPVISSTFHKMNLGWRGVFSFGAVCSLVAFGCMMALKRRTHKKAG